MTPQLRSVRNTALATLALTAAHHVYGGLIYATPWRLHGAVAALAIAAVIAVLAARPSRAARIALVVVVIAIPVLAIGAFEGAYNHVLKNALYFAQAPHAVLVRLFPPPTYELPDDVLFELSGMAQVIPAACALIAVIRLRRHAVTAPRHVALRALRTVDDEPIELPHPVQRVHLQFRRFAGCPICNLHLRSFAKRHGELAAAGIREIVVFHSPAHELRGYDLPFAVIADPDKRLYREFGVGAGRRALLDPRAWATILVAVIRSTVAIARGRERAPALRPHGGRFGLPADFLIAPDGTVVAEHRGVHADDQWSVDDVLAIP